MISTPYGETCDLDDLMSVAVAKKIPVSRPIVIRVIEQPVDVTWVDDEDMTPEERLETLRVVREAETRTFTLDPEDIEYIDGIIYLVVGSQED